MSSSKLIHPKLIHPKLIIAGGGTGGHILPGVAIADAWKKKYGDQAQILFVGAKGALEERLVPKNGYRLNTLWIGGLNRVSVLQRLRTAIQLPFAFLQSAWILIRVRPNWIVGVGGYSSGPFVLMACWLAPLLKFRTALVEPNSVPGYTNRRLGRTVSKVFVSFKKALEFFPKEKVTQVGAPLRSQMRPLPSAPRQPFCILIFGGSQGAVGMNTMVIEALPRLIQSGHAFEFIHQTGKIDFERVKKAYESLGIPARVEVFLDDMVSCYQKSSLAICRSGASTLAELSAVRRAAILVPLPTAADNHQVENAKECASSGGAWIVEQTKPGQSSELAEKILQLAKNNAQLAQMEQAIAAFCPAGGATAIVENLESLA